MKLVSILSFSALALAGFSPGCHRSKVTEPRPEPPPTEVWLAPEQVAAAKLVIEPLAPQPVGGVVLASGRVTFDDLQVSHVLSPVTGRVIKIEAQPGQRVKKGDTLAQIESPDVASAFSDLEKAQADYVAAAKESTRQRELYTVHAGSQRDLESAQAEFDKAKAELERAKKKARLLRSSGSDKLNQTYTLRAPIDGEVIARNVNPGAEVQGQYSGGQVVELFTIGELDSVWVLGDIFEMDLGRVHAGTACLTTVVSYPGRVFRGQADWVSDTLDPATHTSKVRCKVANLDRALKPEMFATVSLPVDRQMALAIPRGALLRLGDRTVVFVQVGQAPDGRLRFERRPVVVNEEQGGEYLPVQRNLAQGDRVVISGAILLSGML
jgi:cobalt-zinc-cadmium efflux system membrane fusion protein